MTDGGRERERDVGGGVLHGEHTRGPEQDGSSAAHGEATYAARLCSNSFTLVVIFSH